MIFYFTGTGNSLAAALVFAEETKDDLVDIGQAFKHGKFEFTFKQGEDLGFVFPTHRWSTPSIVDSFIKQAHFHCENDAAFAPKYCYLVLTCGTSVGNTARFFKKELQTEQGIKLDASFSIKSVDSCVSRYSPAEGARKERMLHDAHTNAVAVSKCIMERESGYHESRNLFDITMSSLLKKASKARSTSEFYTLSVCTGCGQCADICPTNTITLVEKRPQWAKSGCTQCFACIHRCPAHSIQFGKETETRGRYMNPALLEQD